MSDRKDSNIEWIPFSKALEIAKSDEWNGTMLWARQETSEILIYQGLDLKTFKSDGVVYMDCTIETEHEYQAAIKALSKAGFTITTNAPVLDSKDVIIFWNINAHS